MRTLALSSLVLVACGKMIGDVPDAGDCTFAEGDGSFIVASKQQGIGWLLSDDHYVFWYTKDNTIHQADLLGCNPTTLATTNIGVESMAIDDAYLYWSDAQGIHRVAKGTTNGDLLTATEYGAEALAVDDANAYYLSANGGPSLAVYSLPKSGGTPTLLSTEPSGTERIGFDASYLYWVRDFHAIVKMPKSGGDVQTLYEDPTDTYALSVDDTSIYWGNETSIMKMDKNGASPPVALAPALVARVELDDTSVYWLQQNQAPQTKNSVSRVSKSGGSATVVIPTSASQDAMAVTSKAIYWVDLAGAQLLMTPKK
jgi:hypothetical protein